jgi:ribose transport system ATP-binding protein
MLHNGDPILTMRNVSKTFGTVMALKEVHLDIHPGEIHALMGENGAGKSTLMKIMAGAYTADAGAEIVIDGKKVRIDSPMAAKDHGIAIIYQELSLAPNLTVAENVYLGSEPSALGMVNRQAMEAGCTEILERLGARFGPKTIVSRLSIAERQMVEIARALRARSRILVMDEPTTALSSRETDALFQLIRQLRDEGLAIIYISHRMAEVYDLSNRVSVLRDGRYIGTLTGEEINPQSILKMMVGRDLSSFYKKEHRRRVAPDPVLDVSNVGDGRRVHACGLTLHRGEVVGLAGLVGAGRTELARQIYGADPRLSGDIRLQGVPLSIRRPNDAIDAGIVYLTEDRKAQGLFLDMSVEDNVNLNIMPRDARQGVVLDLAAARRRAVDAVRRFSIRVQDSKINVGTLSGGNQQKVLLARLLETNPKIIILDEPTRGVDVGAKSEIYRIIDDLAQNGAAILVISSEMPELVGICDRILVMREGRIVGEVGGEDDQDITQEAIIALATGVSGARAAAQ